MHRDFRLCLAIILLSATIVPVCLPGCSTPPGDRELRGDYAGVAAELTRLIKREIDSKGIPALSIALVDDQEIVWARGFGMADPERKIPATADTIYRAGSVSKLFTDIAIMELVGRGELDLDAPITRYLPDFRPENPHEVPLTLRQLMSHHSGLVREPPVGHYFDSGEPSLGETVRSLHATRLVYRPGSRQKYSNAGVAVCGHVLETIRGQPFALCIEEAGLEPMGLESSAFRADRKVRRRLARASMWTYDGRVFPAPTFELGTSPAGNLYSSVNDLARFLGWIFRRGAEEDGRILQPETLESMWKPQFAPDGRKTGFGLGFHVSEFEGHRRIGHSGAVYGFSTVLAALPDARLGVVAISSMDMTHGAVRHICDQALRWMLAHREGLPRTLPEHHLSVGGETARRLAGRYASGDRTVEIVRRSDRIFLQRSGFLTELKRSGADLVIDDLHSRGLHVTPSSDGKAIEIGDTKYERVATTRPAETPWHWKGLIGEYGEDHNVLHVLEKDGKLHALIEWLFLYPLEEISESEFLFPDHGLYHGERIIFSRDPDGLATRAMAAGVPFRRRPIGTAEGETFRIRPRLEEAELRRTSLAAEPPVEHPPAGSLAFRDPDLVELQSLDSTIHYDIRYATTNNFMSMVFYEQPRAFLQRPAAVALVSVHRALGKKGYGLLIFDAYRPWYVTKMFWDATPESMRDFVADPGRGSRHNRGCAVDLGLYDLATGRPVVMVAGYDEFSVRSRPDYPGGTSLQRWHRTLLRQAMEDGGFTVYEHEWWHFDYEEWREYPLLNVRFEEMEERAATREGERQR